MRPLPLFLRAHDGGIEIVNKLVLNVLRSQLSELQWPTRHWPRLLAPLRHYLNNKRRPLLKNKAPIELALGIPREDPLSLVLDADAKLERAMKELAWTRSATDDLCLSTWSASRRARLRQEPIAGSCCMVDRCCGEKGAALRAASSLVDKAHESSVERTGPGPSCDEEPSACVAQPRPSRAGIVERSSKTPT